MLPRISRSLSTVAASSKRAAARVGTLDPNGSVFAEFTPLAIKHNAVNLGQGFPNLEIPEFIKKAATNAINGSTLLNQYTRSQGHLRLANALSKAMAPKMNRDLNPLDDIVVTVGASEAIYSTIQAFINPGDEVIMMEPFYDSYPASVLLAGGKPVYVTLKPAHQGSGPRKASDWKLDIDDLRKAITPKTKMIMINTPHNPIGKVFTKEELIPIANLAKEKDLLVLSDEVYETLVFSDSVSKHVSIASLPGMFERTISVGSVGKTFSVTGWKIGWAVGHKELMRSLWLVHQFIPFVVTTPLQEATAVSFEQAAEHSYFERFIEGLEKKRNKLVKGLEEVGLTPTIPDGSYFILADTSKVAYPPAQFSDRRRDFNVCRYLTAEAQVAAIPPSAFYSPAHEHLPGNLARFCFIKTDDMLDEGIKRLKAFYKK